MKPVPTGQGVFVRDLNDRILRWGRNCAGMYGWNSRTAIGAAAQQLLDTRSNIPLRRLHAELLKTDRWEGVLNRKTAKGADIDVRVTWTLRRDRTGAPCSVVEDNTIAGDPARVASLDDGSGETGAGRYANLFHSIGVICFEFDYRGVQALYQDLQARGVVHLAAHLAAHPGFARQVLNAILVRDANDDAVAFIGATGRDQIIGKPIAPFWMDETSDECREALIAGFSGISRFQTRARLKTFHSQPRHVVLTVFGTPAMRQSGIVVASAVDITDRVFAHSALEKMQNDFAHASRVSVLGEMTASLAHEVNQPLAAIGANGAAALRWLSRRRPDIAQITKITHCMVDDAHRAAEIIARTRRMASRQNPEAITLDINPLITESLDFLRYEINSRRAAIVTTLADNLPATLGDKTLLQQVLVNLVMNALQAMTAAGGETRRIGVSSARSGDRVIVVSVEDTGPGIDPDCRDRMFEGFYSTKPDGMGMGLAICRSIVERHGGRIWLDDSCVAGARFVFSLPAAPAGP